MRNDRDGAMAERIATAMRAAGLNKKELAERAGLKYGVLRAYLSGARSMPARLVPGIAQALGVSCDWILTGMAADLDPDQFEKALAAAWALCAADEGFDPVRWARTVFFTYNRDYGLRFGFRHEVAPLPQEILDRWSRRPSGYIMGTITMPIP